MVGTGGTAGCPRARLSPVPVQVTSYGGELQYTVTHHAPADAQPLQRQPDVLLQGNGIFLEHFSDATPAPGVPTTVTVPFREVRAGVPLGWVLGLWGHIGHPRAVPTARLAPGGRARCHPGAPPDGPGRHRCPHDPRILHGPTDGEQVPGRRDTGWGQGTRGQGGGDILSRPAGSLMSAWTWPCPTPPAGHQRWRWRTVPAPLATAAPPAR